MFGTTPPSSITPHAFPLSTETHVEHFTFQKEKQSHFIFPFEMMTYFMLLFLALGLFFALYHDDQSVGHIAIWIHCVFAPFYLPGLYHYYQYLSRDQHSEIELDSRHGLIKFTNASRQENLLFHVSQIQSCRVHYSILFPYRIDRLTLHLSGGRQLHISGLVVPPLELLSRFDLPYQIERRLFNAAPKDWPKETPQAA